MTNRALKVVLVAVGMLVLVPVLVLIWLGATHRPEHARHAPRANADDALVLAACAAAQREVLERLKAPATAKFPSCAFEASAYKITASPDRAKVGVQGYVDSQNSYGAMIRSRFVVLFNKAPGDDPTAFVAYKAAVE